MRVIVTDHHLPGATLPDADAIVDPCLPGDAFPSKALAGVGVVFYVLLALRAALRAKGWFGPDRAEPDLSVLLDLVALGTVAGPAVLTNLATPVGAAFVTHSIAQFGPSAVAGAATIDRLTPVAFGLVYALSGAVGPILAQNLGAGQFRRVQEGLRGSLLFMVASVAVAWLVLAVGQGVLIRAFSAEGQAAELISLFCSWLAASFFFAGGLFVANASFNNLGHPLLSTGFNWGRATLGTIPFAWWGSHYGAAGVLIGQAVGSSIFGLLAVIVAFRLAAKLARQEVPAGAAPALDSPVAPASPQAATAPAAAP